MSKYVLDDALGSNLAVTDTVKLVTVKAMRKPVAPVRAQVLPLADAEFWMISAVIFGILAFIIGRAS